MVVVHWANERNAPYTRIGLRTVNDWTVTALNSITAFQLFDALRSHAAVPALPPPA
jgi:hypothetical protein